MFEEFDRNLKDRFFEGIAMGMGCATIVFVYKHTVRNPKRYGTACEGIMFDENDRFLTELCKLRARTRSKRFYRERCPGKCNAAK